ncbi:hypothetical protein [Nitrosomonas sp. Nm132]|uniref:hypothetical protein n=1 Tax=Nitrosomonas sp. Nm132 TaxID=1881053 RepID=UPI00087F1E4E|nr:hypothetical protein [Nitrosomonas sp. Nm132]SDH54110.1 hypothetical protein SAMN05428952_101726 [Nitrosomonas sp. Nm132]
MAKDDLINVIATFVGPGNNQSNAAAAQQAIGPFTLQREFTLIHGFQATMTAGQVEMLSYIPNIFRVEEDPIVTT